MLNVRQSVAVKFAICLSIATLLLGCGKPNEHNTAIVHGKVTYKGKPVNKGNITFYPEVMGPPAYGTLNDDGTFTLSTYEQGDGATVGKHKVSVVSKEDQTNFEANAAPTDGKWLIPAKYFLESSSGLTADVKADQDNEINFELTD